MIIKNDSEYKILCECGKRLGAILKELAENVKPGITTGFFDELANDLIHKAGGDAVFRGYRAYGSRGEYTATLCTSVNSEIVHGIPRNSRLLKEGDVIGLDIGMRYPSETGLITDTALTIPVGKVSALAAKLIRGTNEALDEGIRAARVGGTVGDIGHAVETRLKKYKLSIIRELVGHGVGRKLHEDPYIPNFGTEGKGILLKDGMVVALEPMASLGSEDIILDDDGWTYKTADGSLAAHFEHTIAIFNGGVEILTKL